MTALIYAYSSMRLGLLALCRNACPSFVCDGDAVGFFHVQMQFVSQKMSIIYNGLVLLLTFNVE